MNMPISLMQFEMDFSLYKKVKKIFLSWNISILIFLDSIGFLVHPTLKHLTKFKVIRFPMLEVLLAEIMF
jgi:hypothetical protein